MFKILLLLVVPTLALANPIRECQEFLEGELWYYEYYPSTKLVGDALYYPILGWRESQADRDSRLLTKVHEIFRANFHSSKKFYTKHNQEPESQQKQIAGLLSYWRSDSEDEWYRMRRPESTGCSRAPHRPSQVCYDHFESYFPFLVYLEDALIYLRSSDPGRTPNDIFLNFSARKLAKNFSIGKFPIEDIAVLLIQFEETQKGSSGVIISGFEGHEGAMLFSALLKSFRKRTIESSTSAAGRVFRALEIRDDKLKKRLSALSRSY